MMSVIQGNVAVTTSSTKVVGPHPKRRGIILSAPPPTLAQASDASVIQQHVDTSTVGIKASYTVPAGKTAVLTSATMFETTGTTVVANVELVRSAVTTILASFTQKGVFAGPVELLAGDTIQWDVTTNVAASFTDFTLFISENNDINYITVQVGDLAVLDKSLAIYPGNDPLYLTFAVVGEALREPISAIAALATCNIGFMEFFD